MPKGAAGSEALERIRVACREHVLGTLSADQAHHDYVTVIEVLAKYGDGVPLRGAREVSLTWFQGPLMLCNLAC